MKKFLLLLSFQIIFIGFVKSQADKNDLNEIANQIQKVLTSDELQNESFGPIKIVESNLTVFKAGDNIATRTIRKLQLSKKFPTDDSLFKWLIPAVNKIVLKKYFSETSFYKRKYDTLFDKLNTSVCPCITIAAKSKDMMADDNFLNCAKRYLNDTAIITEYRQAYFSIPEENRRYFFSDLLAYSNLNCPDMFNKLIVLAKQEVPNYYTNSLIYYKGAILEGIAKYSLQVKKDSLAAIFPNYAQYPKEIAALQKLYKQNGSKLLYTLQDLFVNNLLERKSALIAANDTSKIKLLGQFVFEVAIDKPVIYVKSIKYYPREAMQGVEYLEKEMEKAKHKIN